MMREININNCREGILTMKGDILTMITDQEILTGDELQHPLHKGPENKFIPIHVDEIIEERPSGGDWKDAPPRLEENKISQIYAR